MLKKVLFLVKKRGSSGNPYTPPFGLLYSAKFIAKALRKRYKARVSVAIDGNHIDKLVTEYNPDVVVIEALWATPAKLKELIELKRHAHRQWVVRLHSKPSFLSLEGIAMEWLGEMMLMSLSHPNFKVAVNNEQARDELDAVFLGKVKLLPNYYIPTKVKEKDHKDELLLKIGCFGALRPLKNTLEQAIAAIIYADKTGRALQFYINATRVEQHAEPVLKNLRNLFKNQTFHRLIEVPWKTHYDFLQIVSKMDLGLQVSFSESFNIVTADFASVGVPIVVSPEIDWMPNEFKASPTDAFDIAKKLGRLEQLPEFWTKRRMRKALEEYNAISLDHWFRFLGL